MHLLPSVNTPLASLTVSKLRVNLGTAATALSGELFITETQDKSRDKFPPAFIYLGSNPIMGLKEKKKKKGKPL